MKKTWLARVALLGALAIITTGCGSSSGGGAASSGGSTPTGPIKVGFAQTGSESGWRSANTESMKAAFSSAPHVFFGDNP